MSVGTWSPWKTKHSITIYFKKVAIIFLLVFTLLCICIFGKPRLLCKLYSNVVTTTSISILITLMICIVLLFIKFVANRSCVALEVPMKEPSGDPCYCICFTGGKYQWRWPYIIPQHWNCKATYCFLGQQVECNFICFLKQVLFDFLVEQVA